MSTTTSPPNSGAYEPPDELRPLPRVMRWVTVGDIGSPARSDYTVLGNEVNLASRLSDHAAAGQILITERTMTEVAHMVHATPVDQVRLKGVSREIKVYEIHPLTP